MYDNFDQILIGTNTHHKNQEQVKEEKFPVSSNQ
jgi:hypothetical protein